MYAVGRCKAIKAFDHVVLQKLKSYSVIVIEFEADARCLRHETGERTDRVEALLNDPP